MSHKVLVVDDEPQIPRLLWQLMEQCGYDVDESTDDGNASSPLSQNARIA